MVNRILRYHLYRQNVKKNNFFKKNNPNTFAGPLRGERECRNSLGNYPNIISAAGENSILRRLKRFSPLAKKIFKLLDLLARDVNHILFGGE